MSDHLSYLLQRIIAEEETPCRRQAQPPATVEAVLRYGAVVGSVIERHGRLSRCMEQSRALIHAAEEKGISFASGTVIMAEELTGGSGRFQRTWHAPGGGLWLTLILVNTILPESSRLYPLAAGVACCEAIRQYNLPARIKWVNDINIDDRKIAGILCETLRGPCYGEEYILIGIGINVNNEAFPPELAKTSGAMKSFLGAAVDLDLFAARLLGKLTWNIGLLHYEEELQLAATGLAGSFSPKAGFSNADNKILLNNFRRLSDSIGRRVLFGYDVRNKPLYEAETLGVNDGGSLILKLDDGIEMEEQAGEILYLT